MHTHKRIRLRPVRHRRPILQRHKHILRSRHLHIDPQLLQLRLQLQSQRQSQILLHNPIPHRPSITPTMPRIHHHQRPLTLHHLPSLFFYLHFPHHLLTRLLPLLNCQLLSLLPIINPTLFMPPR